jgi:hypothetical protein
MKKNNIIMNFALAGLILLSACNPTKDFKDQYDLANTITDSTNFANYTKVKLADTATIIKLTDANYAKSSVSSIKSNKNFSDAYPAKTYLPEIMNKSFIVKTGNQITVAYNYYNPLTLKDSVSYTLTDAEYPNQTYKNFNTVAEIFSYLSTNYPQATRGKLVILTYKIKGTTGAVTCSFVYLGTEWMQAIAFVAANYTAMGQSYANFSTSDDARYNIPIFLKNSFLPYAKAGTKTMVQYALYSSGKTTQNILLLNFDGNNWKIIDAVIPASSICMYNGSVWNFIPPLNFILVTETATRNYTLTDADYTLVGSGQYKDFDRRAGQSEGDVNVFLSKMGTILKTRFADIAANQVYAVTYKDYNGSISNVTVNIKTVPGN